MQKQKWEVGPPERDIEVRQPSLHWVGCSGVPARHQGGGLPLPCELLPPKSKSSLTHKSPTDARVIPEESEQVCALQDASVTWVHAHLEILPCPWSQARMETCSFISAWALMRNVAFQGTRGQGK